MEYARFAALVAPHTEVMARVATALVGPAEADDVAQEALLQAWRGWPSLRDPSAVRTWLLRVTVNAGRNWRARGRGLHVHDTLSLDFALPETFTGAFDLLGTTEHVSALDLRRAVATLSAELRQMLILRYFVGLDATEIGALLDAPPATIRTRLRRALALLRAELGPGEAPAASPGDPPQRAAGDHDTPDRTRDSSRESTPVTTPGVEG